jgi:hypothetical protein
MFSRIATGIRAIPGVNWLIPKPHVDDDSIEVSMTIIPRKWIRLVAAFSYKTFVSFSLVFIPFHF